MVINGLLGETINIKLNAKNIYHGSNNNFGIVGGGAVNWYPCREELAANGHVAEQKDGFLFCHTNKTSEDIAEFVSKFESLVEQGRRKSLHRSTYHRISCNDMRNSDKITWVKPGPFWMRQPMRHSLLTILLRCASYGYVQGGDFWQALYGSYTLANKCQTAIARFMDGYTWYTGKLDGTTSGWYAAFAGLDDTLITDKAWKVLIRPNSKPKEEKGNG